MELTQENVAGIKQFSLIHPWLAKIYLYPTLGFFENSKMGVSL